MCRPGGRRLSGLLPFFPRTAPTPASRQGGRRAARLPHARRTVGCKQDSERDTSRDSKQDSERDKHEQE
jgi:hypothetical protein